MDCLFTDEEAREMMIYANELKANNLSPVIYAAPDWDVVNSSWTVKYTPPPLGYNPNGYIGMYYGMPVYSFDGLDSHTCCVLPNFNVLPF